MTNLILKIFTQQHLKKNTQMKRQDYGNLSSFVGLITNLFLCFGKLLAGFFAGSISIIADGINNLSDVISSLITLVSFKISAKPADHDHPFGHARAEYLFSSVISLLIFFIGFQLLVASIKKILNPTPVFFSSLSFLILFISIILKIWLYAFNLKLSKMIDSGLLRATAMDSFSDILATSVVLVSLLVGKIFNLQVDAYVGTVASLFILYIGYGIMRDNINDILGKEPSQEDLDTIENFIKQYEIVREVHDLIIHNYGPDQKFVSAHVTVALDDNILQQLRQMEKIEWEAKNALGIHLIIHMDPREMNNSVIDKYKKELKLFIKTIDPKMKAHDFRIIEQDNDSILLFDLVVPSCCKLESSEIRAQINQFMASKNNKLRTIIAIDRSYTYEAPDHEDLDTWKIN